MISSILTKLKHNRANFLLFIFTIFLVFTFQNIVYNDHLNYGFRDGDWWLLGDYKRLGSFSLNNLIKAWSAHGIYTYQIYYIGFATDLVGMDFLDLNQLMHLTKLLATLAIFPLILLITKSRLTAFLTTIIFSVAYPVAGAMYMYVTGGYFLAIISLCAFLIVYRYTFNSSLQKFRLMFLSSVLLLLTLFLNTERMFALVLLIPLVEVFWFWRQKFVKEAFWSMVSRVLILLLPLVIMFVVYNLWVKPQADTGRFATSFIPQVIHRTKGIMDGNWQLLLYPFASFGSMFLYGGWWKYIGTLDVSSLTRFLFHFISHQMIIFGVTSAITLSLATKKPFRLILISLIPTFVFGLIIYFIQSNWLTIDTSRRLHLDINEVGIPALFGFYILLLSFSFLLLWLKENENIFASIFLGPFVAFLFIVITWIGSDPNLLFMGPQRYLTTPSIGSSLFLGSLITLIFFKLQKIKFVRTFALSALLLMVPVLVVNAQVNKEFFDYELNVVGMNGAEQIRMQNKFRVLIPDISSNAQSLFYFDETQDKENGYFDESAILAGFEYWIRFSARGSFDANRPDPVMIRSNIHCPQHTEESCLKILKESFVVKDGVGGFLYKDTFNNWKEPRFFRLENFYALRFVQKDIVNIKQEVLKELQITDE